MLTVLVLLCSAPVAIAVHLFATAAAGVALGARVQEIRLGYGERLQVTRRVAIGCVPIGGWVKFEGSMEDPAEKLAPGSFAELAGCRRALIALAGPIVVLGLACVVLGPAEGLMSAARAPSQLVDALGPRVVREQWSAILGLSPLELVGGVFAKLAAFNLLPFPTLAGGEAVLSVLGISGARRQQVTMIGLSSLMVGVLGLLASGVRAVLGGLIAG